MTTSKITFRINDETYLRLTAIAAERGLSVGVYLRKRLEEEDENLLNDIRLMQTDLKDILNLVENLNNKNTGNASISQPQQIPQNFSNNENILLEILMILREIAQPSKLANAQAKVTSVGLSPYKILENQK